MELHAFEELAELVPEMEEQRPMTIFPPVTPPGMAYVPFQQWGKTYDAGKALEQGTVFPVLDMPFERMGGDCTR